MGRNTAHDPINEYALYVTENNEAYSPLVEFVTKELDDTDRKYAQYYRPSGEPRFKEWVRKELKGIIREVIREEHGVKLK